MIISKSKKYTNTILQILNKKNEEEKKANY